MDGDKLMQRAMASLASVGDIFTDAPECAASVKAANNLASLARLLSADTEIVARGSLRADGDVVCDAEILADGTMLVEIPDGLDVAGRTWSVATDGGMFDVAFFEGEDGSDDQWIVDDAEAFYRWLIAAPEPASAPKL